MILDNTCGDRKKSSDWARQLGHQSSLEATAALNSLPNNIPNENGHVNTAPVVLVPHLAGLKVAAVVDGNVEHDLQAAADGTVMLKYAGKRVHVGVPYSAELETLDLVIQRQDGTQLGRRMRIAEVVVRVNKARGVFCGSCGSALEDYKERSREDFGAPIERMSGDLRFNLESGFDEGRVRVSAPLPFSCTVLAVVPVAAVPAALG